MRWLSKLISVIAYAKGGSDKRPFTKTSTYSQLTSIQSILYPDRTHSKTAEPRCWVATRLCGSGTAPGGHSVPVNRFYSFALTISVTSALSCANRMVLNILLSKIKVNSFSFPTSRMALSMLVSRGLSSSSRLTETF